MNFEVRRAAAKFWQSADGSPQVYPLDVEAVACWAAPIGVIHIWGLTTDALQRWLRDPVAPAYGPLHGALIARRGRGLIFVDAADDSSERRFTVAHETAHFLLEYLEPRERLIRRHGEQIRAVLDGDRRPTPAERIDSLLASTALGPHLHLLGRNIGDRSSWLESAADLLALELLAPAAMVKRKVKTVADRVEVRTILEQDFGLPRSAAGAYAERLVPRRRESFREWLGV